MPSVWSSSEWGLPSRSCRHDHWCALTAPFHPYHAREAPMALRAVRRFAFCCTCPSLTAGRCYRPLCSTEPGLSSRLAMLRKPSRDKRPPRLLTSAGIVRQFGLGRIAVARFQQLPCRLATVASSRLFAHAVGKQDTPGDPVHQDAR